MVDGPVGIVPAEETEQGDVESMVDTETVSASGAAARGCPDKKKYPAKKVVWLITYGASGQNITGAMLRECGNFEVDEYYTSTDRSLKYTLFHVTRKVYQTTVEKTVHAVCAKYGVILNNVYGMDAVQSASKEKHGKLRDMPLLKWIVKDFDEKNPSFDFWVAPERIPKALLRRDGQEGSKGRFLELMCLPKKKLVEMILFAERVQRQSGSHA